MILEGKELTEIFRYIHVLILIMRNGHQEACPDGVKLVGIRVRSLDRRDTLRVFFCTACALCEPLDLN